MAVEKPRRKFQTLMSLFFWSAIIVAIKFIDLLFVNSDLTLYGAVCLWAAVAWAAVRWEIKHWS
jgi:hypothetical protein